MLRSQKRQGSVSRSNESIPANELRPLRGVAQCSEMWSLFDDGRVRGVGTVCLDVFSHAPARCGVSRKGKLDLDGPKEVVRSQQRAKLRRR